MMNIIIIEDEAKAARELKNILQKVDDSINVLITLESAEKAVQWFAENQQPDLVFSDIQLADGTCFDIFSQTTIKSPIVFCTAFDEYLMHAFDTNAVSYLLKPITIEKVEKALDKYRKLRTAFEIETEQHKLHELVRQFGVRYKTAILVHAKEKIIPLPVQEIAYLYLDNTIVHLVTLSGQKYFLTSTMDELEKMLDPSLFYRANRQFIICRNAVANAERFFARKLIAKLDVATPETIIVSKAKASDFLKWLEGA